jgi:phage baseplate assembly protein W
MSTYGLAPKLPLVYTEGTGPYVMMKEYVDVVKQNMKMLVLTSPGERIMIPEYGVGLRRVIFEQDTPDLRVALRSRITSQISRYMSYVVLQDLNIISSLDQSELPDNYMRINIDYFVPSLNRAFRLEVTGDRIQKTIKVT